MNNNENSKVTQNSLSIVEKNRMRFHYPSHETIHKLFAGQVNQTPQNTALVYKDIHLSYIELNQRADILSRKLIDAGVKEDIVVCILLGQSIELIVAILAILKAGGAFMIIDPAYPQERIEFMLYDSGVAILLTKSENKRAVFFEGNIIDIETACLANYIPSDFQETTKSNSLAYVLYTSGSTGKPKAVMVEHRNLINTVYYLKSVIGVDTKTKVLQFFSPSFTVSYQEIFTTLLSGGTLYIAEDNTRNNIGELFDFIKETKINLLFLPSSFIKTISRQERYYKKLPVFVNHIVTAGEQLIITDGFLKYIESNKIKLHNNYGTSETNISAFHTIQYDEATRNNPPIGKPTANTYIYILDENLQLVDTDSIGDIYIAGDSVCRGYLNNRKLTLEKFISNPYHGGIMYKTGDLGRWLQNDEIMLMGRSDFQVNIRGFRIDVGEIEYHLLCFQGITEAVVVSKHGEDETDYLCAYIVEEERIQEEQIREYLLRKLPEYMLPKYIIKLNKIPKLPTGKVDRKLLIGNRINDCKERDLISEEVKDTQSIESKLKSIIAVMNKQDDVDFIFHGKSSIKSFGLDSLSFLRLVVLIEDAFNIEFDNSYLNIVNFETMEELIQYIEYKLTKKIPEEKNR